MVCVPGVSTTGALVVAGFADAMLPVGASFTSSGSIVLSSRGIEELMLLQSPKGRLCALQQRVCEGRW